MKHYKKERCEDTYNNKNLKLSRYVLIEEIDNYYYLYNLKNSALVRLDDSTFLNLKKKNFKKLNKNIIDLMKDRGFLVSCEICEGKELIKEMNSLEKVSQYKQIHLTIAPTFLCNLNCDYCFTRKNKEIISQEVLLNIYQLIEYYINKYNSIVNINWFGGEPVLALDAIENFMTKLIKRFGIEKFKTMMTTNGYLLTINNFKKIINSGIKILQITIDGNEERHNIYRTTKDGKGTYKAIIKNIYDILETEDDFLLNIRCNFYPEDISCKEDIFQDIRNIVAMDKRVVMQLKPVLNFKNKESNKYFNNYCEVESIRSIITQSMNKENIYASSIMPKARCKWCNSGKSGAYNIGPKGELYLCKSEFGHEDKIIGYLKDHGKVVKLANFYEIEEKYIKLVNEKCTDCNRLPICMGGCKVFQINKSEATCYWTEEDVKNLYRIWINSKIKNNVE